MIVDVRRAVVIVALLGLGSPLVRVDQRIVVVLVRVVGGAMLEVVG